MPRVRTYLREAVSPRMHEEVSSYVYRESKRERECVCVCGCGLDVYVMHKSICNDPHRWRYRLIERVL